MVRKALAVAILAALLAGCSFRNPLNPNASPNEIVSGKDFQKLLVEIDHPADAKPNDIALATFKDTLQKVTGKTSVEIVTEAQIPSEPGRKYDDAALKALQDQHRTRKTGGDTAVLYILYVSGGYVADTSSGSVLGLASAGGTITIFKGNIRSAQGSLPLGIDKPKEEFIERAVLIHEFGHVVGLVNLGAPMQRPHEDPSNRGHSANQDSVMYWQIETSTGLAQIVTRGSDIPYQFDTDDLADLRALREA